MAEKIFKGFKQVTEGSFSAENGYIYFIRKSSNTGYTDGYLQFNGKKYGTAAEAAESLNGKIGTIPEGYSDLVSYINTKVGDGVNALNANVTGASNGVEVGVVQESGVVTTVNVTAPNFSEIYAPIGVASADTRLAAIEADYLKAADKTELNNAITAETAAREAAVQTVSDNLTAETAARESADSALSGRLDSLEAISGQSHTHENKAVLDSITQAKVDAWDAIAGGAAVELNPNATVTEGYLKTYELSQGGVSLGKIDIPKDLVVTSGQVVEVDGSKFLRLTIANQDTPVDIAVTDLVDVYTPGNGIEISNSNEVSAKVVNANGLSVDSNGIAMALADGSNNGAMSAADFNKLGTIEASAQTNVIETVKVDGTALTVTNKEVNIELPDYSGTYAPLSLTGTVNDNRTAFDNYTGATDSRLDNDEQVFDNYTAATDTRLDNIESSAATWNNVAGSADTRISALEAVSADTRLDALEAASADTRLDALEALSAGTRLDAVEAVSADTRLDALEAVSADTRLDALEALTGDTSSALQSISAGDASVSVGTKSNNDQSVAVAVSSTANNALSLANDGLFAAVYYDGDDSN